MVKELLSTQGLTIFLPVTLKLRNRTSRFSLVPPMKTKSITTGSKLNRRSPLDRCVRHQSTAIKQSTIIQIRISNSNQIHPPIIPNGNTLHTTIHQINRRLRNRMKLILRYRYLRFKRRIGWIGEQEVEWAGGSGGGDYCFLKELRSFEGRDSGRRVPWRLEFEGDWIRFERVDFDGREIRIVIEGGENGESVECG